MLVRLPKGHGAEAFRDAFTKRVVTLPTQLRRSITWDQGPEMSEHVRFSVDTGVQVYFCDPKSPWPRGLNENTNGLLRPRRATCRSTTSDSSMPSPSPSTSGLERPSPS
jgi:IS30 family transposase